MCKWGLWKVKWFRWDREGEAPTMGLVSLLERKRPELAIPPPSEDTVRRQLSESQKKGFLQNPLLLVP